MPLHFQDLDVVSQVKEFRSALIVPCNMCPATTIASREKRPFLRFFNSFLKSAPFEEYLAALQERLSKHGVRTKVFKNNLPHQWFLCMWPAARKKKLSRYAQHYEAIIVLGCQSATETVRNATQSKNCRVIEGMRATGIMNTKLCFSLPADISFQDCRIIPFSSKQEVTTEDASGETDRMQQAKSGSAREISWLSCHKHMEEMV